MFILNRKAQSTLEYAVIVAVVVGALLAIQVYVKRGVQGRLRSSTDNIGDQYSAGHMTSKYITEETTGFTQENVGKEYAGKKGKTKSEVITPATTTRSATGNADAEKVTKKLSEEGLFDPQGTLYDE